MANLLTDDSKRNLHRNFRQRQLVVIGLALGLLLAISLIIFSSFLASLLIRTAGLAKFSSTTDQESMEIRSSSHQAALVKKLDSQVSIIHGYWSEPMMSVMIMKIVTLKPANLKISGLAIARSEIGGVVKLSLAGLTKNRNELVDYVNRLRQDQFFSKVDLPVESLISDQSGPFVINLEK